ncbi:hypothetical protein [Actinomadura violacea]|uniref:Integral membrane protein n=1 Tax=Actinomadura violacea TaxID=2819934 RepID=A0ABS3RML9_9ACTN|nr:hypothetical protein [Actinomadura violacea]MBO2457995.1 hypothetical protein [Actinomadura violacea]
MEQPPAPADALAEIQRTQRQAMAAQRLPVWYAPSVVALGTAAAVGAELGGTAQKALTIAAAAGLAALTAALAARVRVKWRASTWTLSAGTRMALWIVSVLAVWGVVPLIAGTATDSAAWQKAAAGLVTALYAAATTRWIEKQVQAHSGGRVVR